MSRIARKPIIIPKDVKINIINNKIVIFKNNLVIKNIIHYSVLPIIKKNKIIFINHSCYSKKYLMYAGTIRSIINNILIGLKNNFVKKLLLIGIGYKAYIEKKILFLNLGFSYTIKYEIPDYINIVCSNNNEIIIKGFDKQKVGQVAAKIRSFRPPECYKQGKGIRYINEFIRIKENKKKISK